MYAEYLFCVKQSCLSALFRSGSPIIYDVIQLPMLYPTHLPTDTLPNNKKQEISPSVEKVEVRKNSLRIEFKLGRGENILS